MGAGQDAVARRVDERALALGGLAPEQEDHGVAVARERPDGGVRHHLPAMVLMGAGRAGTDGEDGVEHEHAA